MAVAWVGGEDGGGAGSDWGKVVALEVSGGVGRRLDDGSVLVWGRSAAASGISGSELEL